MIDPATRRSWRLAVARHRRLLAAACLAAAVSAGIHALRPDDPMTTRVWVAAADLAAGHTIEQGDLTAALFPRSTVLHEVMTAEAAVGRRLASPVLRGEPLTPARLVGPGLLKAQPPGTLAVAIRPAEPATIAMVRPGDLIDVLSSPSAVGDLVQTPRDPLGTGTVAGSATIVARRVLVLAIVSSSTAQAGLLGTSEESSGAAVLVAVDDETALALTSVVTQGPLTLALRRP